MTGPETYVGWECGTTDVEVEARRGGCLKCLAEDLDGVRRLHAWHDNGDPNERDAWRWHHGGPMAAPGH